MTGLFSKFKIDRSFGKAKLDNTISEWMAPRPCDRCRKRRIRCDRDLNECNKCKSSGFKCTYLDVPKKRGPKVKISTDMAKYMYLLDNAQYIISSDSINLNEEHFLKDKPNKGFSEGHNESNSNLSSLQLRDDQLPLISLSTCSTQFSTISNEIKPIIAYPYSIHQNPQASESQCQSNKIYHSNNYQI